MYKEYFQLDEHGLSLKNLSKNIIEQEFEKIKQYLNNTIPEILSIEEAACIQDTHNYRQSYSYFLLKEDENINFFHNKSF